MPARFRLASDAAASLQSETDLAIRLQRRLRVVAALWALANLCLTGVGLGLEAGFGYGGRPLREAPARLFTATPYFGWFLVVAAAHGAMAWRLGRGPVLGLRTLRRLEWAVTVPPALLFALVTALSLAGMLRTAPTLAIILGMGMAAPWAGMMVVYAVYLPNTWRRCAAGVGLLLATALLPDLAIVPRAVGLDPFHAWLYLAAKGTALAAAAVFAVYGAYRIEELQQDAHAARRLGQYVLGELLGSGGMGQVYLARHAFLRRPCAVKLIHPDGRDDAGTIMRFEREVQATAALSHPNTVQVYDYGHAEDGTFYCVMEYVPGLSLAQLIERHGPVPPARAVHVLVQLCGALGEAHATGLLHRDIKPGNVIVGSRGGSHDTVKLLDFGLVLPLAAGHDDARLTREGLVVGTPAFMSPEQCAGDDTLGPASDIYSLGALAYYLLTGKAVFGGRSPTQMLAAHLYERPRPLAEHGVNPSACLEATVLRCLAKDPADRFPSTAELEESLRRCEEAGAWTEAEARRWWAAVGRQP